MVAGVSALDSWQALSSAVRLRATVTDTDTDIMVRRTMVTHIRNMATIIRMAPTTATDIIMGTAPTPITGHMACTVIATTIGIIAIGDRPVEFVPLSWPISATRCQFPCRL